MGDSVVPGTYTPLKYVMALADYASLQKWNEDLCFSCLTPVNELWSK